MKLEDAIIFVREKRRAFTMTSSGHDQCAMFFSPKDDCILKLHMSF
jgi:hypothetical protein